MSAAKGKAGVAASLEDSKRELRRQKRDRVQDPAQGEPRLIKGEEVKPGDWSPDFWGLPPDCPVQVLGMDGDVLHVVDAIGQHAEITDSSFGQNKVQRLFLQRIGYVYWAWPRFGQGGRITGFDTVAVRDAFYKAGGLKGPFSAGDKVRGLGGWTDKAGNLVLHCGDELYVKGREQPTGDYEGHFYPRRPPIPQPWSQPVTDEMMDDTGLWAALSAFTFERPKVDPVMVLGWIAAAYLGGALPWRPMLFAVGDRAVGKSTLQALVKGVLGDALHNTADTTAAGIYQKVKQDSLPVAVDELEAGADNSRVLAVVKLARLAASGGVMFRGGSNHTGTTFTARNCFFMSAINQPPIPPQDLSRMCLVNLRPRAADRAAERPVTIDADQVGRMILRRLVDNWPRFDLIYQEYRRVLGMGGHDGRGQDTYGTLLACAHLVLGDELLDRYGLPNDLDGLEPWAELLAAADLPEREDASENWRRCITHLLTSRVEAWRNGLRHTVGALLEDLKQGVISLQAANDQLSQADLLAIDAHQVVKGARGYALAIPNSGPMVSHIFRGTDWGGEGGTGVWAGALRQAPTTVVVSNKTNNRQRINGVQRRCSIVLMSELG
ncbi:hypothetical protein GGQ86_000380 [Xanthobacter flavus]|uniref:Uncharacterized protein n=1 Tax=Xanthobacter flavus TaxID=281 RepID=A0A9W6CNH5_XANFL|nr:hypothetical protein [Xanthobacter flavus]MDR6331933.1 hypothetical protein [Xanthobacter flavus]GLI25633.1 hypothetical protein XFLAVUS301_53070 [Xanthobacter flavus]